MALSFHSDETVTHSMRHGKAYPLTMTVRNLRQSVRGDPRSSAILAYLPLVGRGVPKKVRESEEFLMHQDRVLQLAIERALAPLKLHRSRPLRLHINMNGQART